MFVALGEIILARTQSSRETEGCDLNGLEPALCTDVRVHKGAKRAGFENSPEVGSAVCVFVFSELETAWTQTSTGRGLEPIQSPNTNALGLADSPLSSATFRDSIAVSSGSVRQMEKHASHALRLLGPSNALRMKGSASSVLFWSRRSCPRFRLDSQLLAKIAKY
jgi:hypothetical protein